MRPVGPRMLPGVNAVTAADLKPGEFYTTRDVAGWLKVTQKTLENWRNNGTLPAVRIGHTVRYLGADLMRLVPPQPVPTVRTETAAQRKRRAAAATKACLTA